MSRIVYINTHAARYGWYFGRRMPLGYRMAARFWGSGLLDRTGTLYTGFPYQSLYPMPPATARDEAGDDIRALCDAQGRRIVEEALNARRRIQVLWSGGIDSTAALVSLLKAAGERGCRDRLEVLLSEQSVAEYPDFHQRFVTTLDHRFVEAPVTAHIDPSRLVVTGEHGDQIFGSAKAHLYVEDGRAFEPWRSTLPRLLSESLDSPAAADAVAGYIEPLLYASPIPLMTIFDAFWWLNFSLKWQIVGLRLAVFRITDTRRVFLSLRHFFSHSSFQSWSLRNHDKKIGTDWASYKMPLKDYIFDFTGDEEYRRTKIKMPSLKHVLRSDTQARPPKWGVLMDEDFDPVFWGLDRAGQQQLATIPAPNRGR
jgi:hypothetical protein